ncbi:MAG: biopolymer transporter ExbD [Paracoccaceae bacterium]
MLRKRRRRKLSMTSLIDVIFLLLLFFMLSSTFTRFAEVELAASGSGATTTGERPLFLRLSPDRITLNGNDAAMAALPETLTSGQRDTTGDTPVIVALNGPVTAQRLTDLLVTLRGVSGLRITVLGGAT